MRVLHIHGDGAASDPAELRALFAPDTKHAVVPARSLTTPAPTSPSSFAYPDFPALAGAPLPGRLRRIAMAMQGFDLVLTHGYGAIDAAMAHTLFGQAMALPPLVHHEDRVDRPHARRRDWYRRIALGRAAAVIVATERLRQIGQADWQQPASRMRLVPPGADLAAMARKARADALPRLIKRRGERWLGASDSDDGGTDDSRATLLDTIAALPDAWQLVWIGEGPAREAIRAAAIARDLAHRVHTPGPVDAAAAFGLFDLIALGTGTPPATVAAAMAASLAVVASPRADWAELLAPENATRLGEPIGQLTTDDALRRTLGAANRAKAQADHDARRLRPIQAAIYRQAMAGPMSI